MWGRERAPKPYLPNRSSAAVRTAVQQLFFGAGHEALTSAASPRCRPWAPGRPEGRCRFHQAAGLPASEVWVSDPTWDNTAPCSKAPASLSTPIRTTTRPRGLPGSTPCWTRCARCRRAAWFAAARLLPQPHGSGPGVAPVAGAVPVLRERELLALPGPSLQALRRRHREGRLRGCAPWPRRA